MTTTFTYDGEPVIGYGDGIVKADNSKGQGDEELIEQPRRIDNNDWIVIGRFRFNVHPFRADLGGYPVRWIEEAAATPDVPECEYHRAVRPATAARELQEHNWKVANNAYAPDFVMTDPEANK